MSPAARRELLAEAIPVVDDVDSWRFGRDDCGNRLVSVVHRSDVDPICEKGARRVVLRAG